MPNRRVAAHSTASPGGHLGTCGMVAHVRLLGAVRIPRMATHHSHPTPHRRFPRSESKNYTILDTGDFHPRPSME